MLKLIVKMLAIAGMGLGLVALNPAIASAHTASVTGKAECGESVGSHLITWTIVLSDAPAPSHADLTWSSPQGGSIVPASVSNISGKGILLVTQTLNGTVIGNVTLNVHVTWDDRFSKNISGTVTLVEPCLPTTTTTTPSSSTTTTTRPPEVLGATTTTTTHTPTPPDAPGSDGGGDGTLPNTGTTAGLLGGIGALALVLGLLLRRARE